MVKRYGLRDDQWEKIQHLLPGREETVGVAATDNRLCVEAVLYRYRAGIPWRDLPTRFGDGTTCTAASADGRKARCGARGSRILPQRRTTHPP
jgi:transposase